MGTTCIYSSNNLCWDETHRMNYWLVKSEPRSYAIDDLAQDKETAWSGVRNYQARNNMRAMRNGDIVFFYHSGTAPLGIAGVAEVSREAYPDETAQDSADDHFDKRATMEKPIWEMVDIRLVRKLKEVITLSELKKDPLLANILVARSGQRLSVMTVSREHGEYLLKRV